MANSTHKVEVFRVEHLEKHPNADSLSILRVFDNYQAVVRTDSLKLGDLACYVPPDNVLPDKEEYQFLKGKLRIKTTKLRGIVSQGLVLACPPGFKVGDDVAEHLGITHYVPVPGSGSKGKGGGGNQGMTCADPSEPGPKYDIDSWFRYGSLIPEGTNVEITEKIHGVNARASFQYVNDETWFHLFNFGVPKPRLLQSGKFWMGSHNHYRYEDKETLFWRVFYANPWLGRLCKQNPGCVIYGEIFGNIQELKYGMPQGEAFRVFDIWDGRRFLDRAEKQAAMEKAMIPSTQEFLMNAIRSLFVTNVEPLTIDDWADHYVPVLHVGPYSKALVEEYMNGKTTIGGAEHVREGIVIKPVREIWHQHIGRLVLKAVSPDYLK
jgi:RNA ligase (TIGR02306 family)